jgi:hypothetical protein
LARSFHRRKGVFCKRFTGRVNSPGPLVDKTILFPRVKACSIKHCSGVSVAGILNIFFCRIDKSVDAIDRLCELSSYARTCCCTRPTNSSLRTRILSRLRLSRLTF